MVHNEYRERAKELRKEMHLRRRGFTSDTCRPLGCHFLELKIQESLITLDFDAVPALIDLKKRYLELSKIWHPDRPGGDEQKFKQLAEAFRFISRNAAL